MFNWSPQLYPHPFRSLFALQLILWQFLNIQILLSEMILAWENGSQGHHFGKFSIFKFLKDLTHSAWTKLHLELDLSENWSYKLARLTTNDFYRADDYQGMPRGEKIVLFNMSDFIQFFYAMPHLDPDPWWKPTITIDNVSDLILDENQPPLLTMSVIWFSLQSKWFKSNQISYFLILFQVFSYF